jgi:hypothetical protein
LGRLASRMGDDGQHAPMSREQRVRSSAARLGMPQAAACC